MGVAVLWCCHVMLLSYVTKAVLRCYAACVKLTFLSYEMLVKAATLMMMRMHVVLKEEPLPRKYAQLDEQDGACVYNRTLLLQRNTY